MPKKPVTWIGLIIILAGGVFSSWALIQFRNDLANVDTRFQLVTVASFLAPAVAALALFLWYYFNEKA